MHPICHPICHPIVAAAITLGLAFSPAIPAHAASADSGGATGRVAQSTGSTADAPTPTVRRFHRVTAAGGRLVTTGRISLDGSVPVAVQAFAPYAGTGAWRLDPGGAMRCTVDAPAGASRAVLEVQSLGWLGSPDDHTFEVIIGGTRHELPSGPSRTLTTHRLDFDISAGGDILLANNRDAGQVGIISVTVLHDEPLPRGGRTVASPAVAGDEAAKGAPADVSVTLLGPRDGQQLDRERGIPIEWEARGFPPGSGVAIYWRRAGGAWQVIPEAKDLPYNHPSGAGNRGHFLWRPPTNQSGLIDISFALAWEPRARRDPVVFQVGSEGGLETVQEALALARNGDEIILAPGEYEGPFDIAANVTIRGAGADRTVLKIDDFVGISVPKGSGLDLYELTIDMEPGLRRDRVPTGIVVNGALDAKDVAIRSASVGVRIAAGGAAGFERLQLENVNVGVHAERGRTAIRGLTMVGGELGLRVEGAGGTIELVDSSITDVRVGGFATSGGTLQMTDTTVTGLDAGFPPARMAENRGITANGGARLIVRGGTVADFSLFGVEVSGEGSRLQIAGATVRGIAWNGISVSNKASADIHRVTIEGCGRFGLTASRAPGVILRDSVLRNNPGTSALFEFSPDSEVRGNQTYGNGQDQIRR